MLSIEELREIRSRQNVQLVLRKCETASGNCLQRVGVSSIALDAPAWRPESKKPKRKGWARCLIFGATAGID